MPLFFVNYWKEIALVLAVIAIGFFGWHLHTLQDYKIKYETLAAQTTANNKASVISEKQAMKFEGELTKLRLKNGESEDAIQELVRKSSVYNGCSNTAPVLKLLQSGNTPHN